MVTSQDLVNDLGLSRTAISQIINGKGRYSPTTRERVLAYARQHGYTPHAGARPARLKRFDTLTLFNASPFWQGIPHPGLYEGCMRECANLRFHLLMDTVTADGMPGLAQRSNLLGERNCDGLLMNYHMQPSADVKRLVDACGIPVIWLNVRLDDSCFHPDDHAAARHLTRALLERGRRRLAYVDTNHHDYQTVGGLDGAHYSVAARWTGVRAVLDEAGLPLRQLTPGSRPFAEKMALARAYLAAEDRPDALICYNEHDAQLMLLAAAENGLRPGEDIGIAQFCESPHVLNRPLATAVIPFRALATEAVKTLVDCVNSGSKSVPTRIIPYTYSLDETL